MPVSIGLPYKKDKNTIGFKLFDNCFEPEKEYYVNVVVADNKIGIMLYDRDGNLLQSRWIEDEVVGDGD